MLYRSEIKSLANHWPTSTLRKSMKCCPQAGAVAVDFAAALPSDFRFAANVSTRKCSLRTRSGCRRRHSRPLLSDFHSLACQGHWDVENRDICYLFPRFLRILLYSSDNTFEFGPHSNPSKCYTVGTAALPLVYIVVEINGSSHLRKDSHRKWL
jgi:hypothetical protein